MLRINLTELFVDDQEKARVFYTDKLGFRVHTDEAYGSDGRWLSVVPPDDPCGVELELVKANEPAKAVQEYRRSVMTPAMSFITDDLDKTYETLVAGGVNFVLPPTKMDYGGRDAMLEDECGNLIGLHQQD
jgi:catechol 2,3-dioxygenase-like lactoylglutathione lyase family enzyme